MYLFACKYIYLQTVNVGGILMFKNKLINILLYRFKRFNILKPHFIICPVTLCLNKNYFNKSTN